jgi:SRSO17 transposase
VKQKLRSRFAALRVRPAHRHYWWAVPHAEDWLRIEWPPGEAQPTRYWLSTLPAAISWTELVRTAKHRWIVERDYEELKQGLGWGRFEGRSWRGFHHHATLCLAAHGFLVAERFALAPSGITHHRLRLYASPWRDIFWRGPLAVPFADVDVSNIVVLVVCVTRIEH